MVILSPDIDVIAVLHSFTSEQWYFVFINFFLLILVVFKTVISCIIAWRCIPKIIDLIAHRFFNKKKDNFF